MKRGWLAVGAAALAAACLLSPTIARADGDPASDVLLSQTAFVPVDAGFSAQQQSSLRTLLEGSAKAGFPLRVAVIPEAYDLGYVTQLWHQPPTYARFLGIELSLVFKGPLLVVMPERLRFQLAGALCGVFVRTAVEARDQLGQRGSARRNADGRASARERGWHQAALGGFLHKCRPRAGQRFGRGSAGGLHCCAPRTGRGTGLRRRAPTPAGRADKSDRRACAGHGRVNLCGWGSWAHRGGAHAARMAPCRRAGGRAALRRRRRRADTRVQRRPEHDHGKHLRAGVSPRGNSAGHLARRHPRGARLLAHRPARPAGVDRRLPWAPGDRHVHRPAVPRTVPARGPAC